MVDCPDSSSTQGSPSSDSQSEYDTSFNRAIRNLNIPTGLLSPTKEQPVSETDLLTLRQELERLRTRLEVPNRATMGDSEKEKGDSLPDFKNSGRYEGDIPASRWLTRLAYDFRKASKNVPKPELYLEAIEMLLEGEPARRLDSTPRIRKIIDKRATATQFDVDTVKEWLTEEFPTSVQDITEADVQTEIENLSQGNEEALATYYQRTVSLLRRTHGRDKPREDSNTALSGLETTMLNCVVNAFVKGIYEDELRRSALHKDAATCGALWKSYEMVQASQRSISLERQVEETLANKRRLTELEKIVQDFTGRPVTAVLSEVQSNPNAFKKSFPIRTQNFPSDQNTWTPPQAGNTGTPGENPSGQPT
jgi:hypothetical protein